MPSSRATTHVRVSKTIAERGRSRFAAAKSAVRPFARPMPAAIPISDAVRPTANASRTTLPITCGRVAPSVRSVASSRVRCATVIDSVLKMTNAPTNSAITPKPRSAYRMKSMNSDTPFLSAVACSAAVRTCAFAGSSVSMSRISLSFETPSRPATMMTS